MFSVALYLQKFIVYRKRKIFFGEGGVDNLLASILKHRKNEKFMKYWILSMLCFLIVSEASSQCKSGDCENGRGYFILSSLLDERHLYVGLDSVNTPLARAVFVIGEDGAGSESSHPVC